MKQPIDLARENLAVADRDIEAFQMLAASPSVADTSVGFHAQQAIEKCLKAVLLRYDLGATGTLNRQQAGVMVRGVRAWAGQLI